jgi:agmatine deiminase
MKSGIVAITFCAVISIVNLTNAQRPMRIVAEFEPCFGSLISWPLGIPQALVVDLAKDDTLYVAVGSTSDQSSAKSQFTAWGVNMNHCVFIQAPTNTHWSRDWGPHCTFDSSGVGGILDPVFNGYPHVSGCTSAAQSDEPIVWESRTVSGEPLFGSFTDDDKVNGKLAGALGWPLRSMPCYFTGGNNMVDGMTIAISTQLMVDENVSNSIDAATFKNYAKKYCGITNYLLVDKPEPQGIQHIDCFAKYLDEETILIKEVASSNPDYRCTERLADQIKALKSCYGRPYKIVRILCGAYSGSSVAAYTNSIIVNKKVYVPLFGISTDQSALETFRKAMPGYTVTGYTHNGQWYYYDALHCRTMGIFDRYMLRIVHRSLDSVINAPSDIPVGATIDDRSEKGLIMDKCLVYWRKKGSTTWESVPFAKAAGLDSMIASIPNQASGTGMEYYLQAADSSGRTGTLPRSAPSWVFSFKVQQGSSVASRKIPLNHETMTRVTVCTPACSPIAFSVPRNTRISLHITDISGRVARNLVRDAIPGAAVYWDGTIASGQDCPNGLYLLVVHCNDFSVAKSMIVSR